MKYTWLFVKVLRTLENLKFKLFLLAAVKEKTTKIKKSLEKRNLKNFRINVIFISSIAIKKKRLSEILGSWFFVGKV